jgi:hypothetical protein
MTIRLRNPDAPLCVLGTHGDVYTQLMLAALRNEGEAVDFAILVRRAPAPAGAGGKLTDALAKLLLLRQRPGPYQTLSPLTPYFWRRLLRNRRFPRTRRFRELVGSLVDRPFEELLRGAEVVNVPSVNHVNAYLALTRHAPALTVFAGVGMVASPLISASEVALNAHPAPLPECRGGGALEHTLLQGLQPAASVHIATPSADGGPILSVTPVRFAPTDDWESAELRLTIQCARSMAACVRRLRAGEKIETRPNGGTLRFWRDLSAADQRRAEALLRRLLATL